MGIALLSIADLFVPLQSFASRWMPVRPMRRRTSSSLRYVGVRPSCAVRPAAAGAQAEAPAPVRPLRVVRTVDAVQSGRRASRVLISGRIADVCAELDRLAALEAADAAPRSAGMH